MKHVLRSGWGLSVSALAVLVAAAIAFPMAFADEGKTAANDLKVHRLGTTQTSPYDAFAYLNRINTDVSEDENAKQFSGRLFGRLANQEGRVLLKLPTGFSPLGYDGLKIFYRTDGTARTGNCVSCHMPPNFTDMAAHIVDESKTARETPGLRNLAKTAPYLHDDSAKSIEEVLKRKIHMSATAREMDDSIDSEFGLMNITEEDIPALVDFLKTLNEIDKEGYRDIIMNAEILDTSNMY